MDTKALWWNSLDTKGITMTINVKRVLIGGLAAGIVLIIINLFAQFMFGNRIRQDMNAWSPGLAERMTMTSAAIATGIILKFAIGILLIWCYAAIRLRFGPGPRTASYSALFVWILGGIFFSDYLMIGMMSTGTYIIVEAFQLLAVLLAAWTGGWIYSE